MCIGKESQRRCPLYDSFGSINGCSYPWYHKFIIISQIINSMTLAENLPRKRRVDISLCFKHFNHKISQLHEYLPSHIFLAEC